MCVEGKCQLEKAVRRVPGSRGEGPYFIGPVGRGLPVPPVPQPRIRLTSVPRLHCGPGLPAVAGLGFRRAARPLSPPPRGGTPGGLSRPAQLSSLCALSASPSRGWGCPVPGWGCPVPSVGMPMKQDRELGLKLAGQLSECQRRSLCLPPPRPPPRPCLPEPAPPRVHAPHSA